jgi:Putative  PD-(D/E)XK family member, (DUF4420)
LTDAHSDRVSTVSLRALFASSLAACSLPPGAILCALPIPQRPSHRLGKGPDGSISLILAVSPGRGAPKPDVQLQNIRVQRRIHCEITRPTGEVESLQGSIITCLATSTDLRDFFLELFGQALATMEENPTEEATDRWIDHCIQLFAELEDTSGRNVRGLWGELLLIAESTDPTALARRWHSKREDIFDFSSREFALEVKTSADLERIHEFSLAQLRSAHTEVVIASVPVLVDPLGQSILDLLMETEGKVPDDAVKAHLRRIAFAVGGSALAELPPRRFDRTAAAAGLRYFRATQVPAVEPSPDAAIIEVRLRVRCRDIPDEELADEVIERLSRDPKGSTR